jgi:two-component system cell cycle sensor histidine kinase/response regulator CckA
MKHSIKIKLPEKIFNAASAAVVILNTAGEIVWINDAFQRHFGYDLAALQSSVHWPFLSADNQKKFSSGIRQALLGRLPDSFDIPITCSDKSIKTVRWNTMLISNEDNPQQNTVAALGVETGSNEQNKEDVKEAQERYRLLFENAGVGIMYVREDMTITVINKEFEKITGYSRDQAEEKMSWTALIANEDDLVRMKEFHRLRRIDPHLAPEAYNTKIRTRSGEIRDIMLRVIMIPGTTNGLVSFLDITEKRLAEEAIRESEQKYRTLVENMQDTIYHSDLAGNITFASPSGARLLGYDSVQELIGKNIARDFYNNPADRAIFLNKLKTDGRIRNYEVTLKRKDGTPVSVSTNSQLFCDINGNVLGVEGIFSDMTQRKLVEEERQRLQEQLLQSQKMDAIGQLAGGVAHDFNNILTGIQGNVSLLMMNYSSEHPHYRRLSRIEEHVKRGANLTRQLLGFARKGKYEVKPLSINNLIRKSAQFFMETRKEIEADFQLQDDIDPVEADTGQIEQMLLNLYINAGHAMPKGGYLYIQTKNVTLPEVEAQALDIKPGAYVKISVSDTGTGMDAETLMRIFEPFFTTKAKQGGTGLGLASAYGIIRNHGGAINAYSRLGAGSTFNIYLPSSIKKVHEEDQKTDSGLRSGSGGILLVDDEPMILGPASEVLKMLGYTVYQTASGQEAVSTYLQKKENIDLVILDMILPGMSGSQTLKMLKDINPAVKVILSSGYSMQGEVRKVMEMGCLGFIQKPYNFTDLSNIVYSTINSSSHTDTN